MKLAVVAQHCSTGGWRYVELLSKELIRKGVNLTVFVSSKNIENHSGIQNIINTGARVEDLYQEGKKVTVKKIYRKLKNIIYKKSKKSKNECYLDVHLKDYDVVFYAWPYDIEPPEIDRPLFFIPHDFIFTHFFGFHSGHLYTREWWMRQKQQIDRFAKKGKAIVSSPYVKEEFIRTCPERKSDPDVVFLSSFNDYKKLSHKQINETLSKLNINDEYILYANNWALHKNMQPVLGAYFYVKQKYPNIKLIITGYGTDNIYCQCNSPYYLDHIAETEPYDVKSLGLLNDADFSAVLQGAKMIVNASLCEAGSGSSLDAWELGIPVAMSEIDPFKQQLKYLKTFAELFDPRNSNDIARAILKILDHPEASKEKAEKSKEALSKYTWADVAEQYLNIFKRG